MGFSGVHDFTIQIKHYVVLGFLEVGLFRPISLTMTTAKVCMLYIDELHSVLPHVVGEKVMYIYIYISYAYVYLYIYIYTIICICNVYCTHIQ